MIIRYVFQYAYYRLTKILKIAIIVSRLTEIIPNLQTMCPLQILISLNEKLLKKFFKDSPIVGVKPAPSDSDGGDPPDQKMK